MAITRGATTGKFLATNAASASGNMGSTPTVGSLVVVPVVGYAGVTWQQGDVTDNQGNTYLLACVTVIQNFPNGSVAIFYAEDVAASGTFTVTVNPQSTGNNYFTCVATEFTGVGTVRLLDRVAVTTANAGTTTPSVGPTAAVSEADSLVIAVMGMETTLASITVESVSPAWVQEFEELSFSNMPGEADSRIITGGGTQSCNWTTDASAIYGCALAVFSDPGVSGGGGGSFTFAG